MQGWSGERVITHIVYYCMRQTYMFCARSSQNLAENRAAPHFTCFSPPRGGGVVHDFSRLVQTWCRGGSGPFLCIGWSVHGNKKMVLEIIFFGAGNPFFGAGNQFFGENLVLEIHFLGVGNLDESSGRFS